MKASRNRIFVTPCDSLDEITKMLRKPLHLWYTRNHVKLYSLKWVYSYKDNAQEAGTIGNTYFQYFQINI